MLDEPARRDRRLERLREELEDAGARVRTDDEIGLLKEIDRARSPRRHERRFPSYGAILVSATGGEAAKALDEIGAVRFATERAAARQIRPMADGVQSFALMRRDSAELVLLPSPIPREVEMIRLRRALGAGSILVCRSTDGVVRVVDHGQIVIFDGTRWWTKPDARRYTTFVQRAVPAAPVDTTEHILDFCVHSAGPAPGGTILVWCLNTDALTSLRRRSTRTQPALPLSLPLTLPVAHSAIHQLLSQVDGAAAVNHAGDLVEIGLHLRASSKAQRSTTIAPSAGTRHASAQQCSFDVADALFFVVSDDGPVTVYANGSVVASINFGTVSDRATSA